MAVTLGLLTVGLLILAGRLAWLILKNGAAGPPGKGAKGKGTKVLKTLSANWKDLLPFGFSALGFALAASCVGGLLGNALGWTRDRTADLGDWGLNQLTGAATLTTTKAAEKSALTSFSAVLVLVLVVVLAVAWKCATDVAKKEILFGGLCGLGLGPFLGALALVPLVNWFAENTIGALFYA